MRARASERARRVSGSITVFLSLTLLLVLTLIGALCASAAVQTAKSRAKSRTSLAVESVFAEYDTDLLERYHLFAYDAERGGQDPEEGVCERVKYYGGGPEVAADQIQYLTDDQGDAIVEQAILYMESKEMLSLPAGDHAASVNDWVQSVGESLLAGIGGGLPETGLEDLLSLFRLPLAQTALPRGRALSGGKIELAQTASRRTLNQGRGTFQKNSTGGLINRGLFDEYLMEVCDNAARETERVPAYEAEYLIAGLASDKDNLEAVLTRILAIRMAVNASFLRGDAAKQAELEAQAAFLALACAAPAAQPAIKEALLAAWAYTESMAEIRALLAGKRIARTKNAANWKINAAGVLSLDRSVTERWEADDQEGGISYEDFLRGFLRLMPQGKKAMRLADLIEINITRIRGSVFRADGAVCRLRTLSTEQMEHGVTFRYQNIFAYR